MGWKDKSDRSAYSAIYREKNRERLAAYRAAWRAANKEKEAQSVAAYHAANREKINALRRARMKKGHRYPSYDSDKAKAYHAKYVKNHRDVVLKCKARYREANRDKIAAYMAAWRSANNEKIRVYQIAYSNRKISLKLQHAASALQSMQTG